MIGKRYALLRETFQSRRKRSPINFFINIFLDLYICNIRILYRFLYFEIYAKEDNFEIFIF